MRHQQKLSIMPNFSKWPFFTRIVAIPQQPPKPFYQQSRPVTDEERQQIDQAAAAKVQPAAQPSQPMNKNRMLELRHELNNLNVQFQQSIESSQLPADFQARLTASIASAFHAEFEVLMQIEQQAPEDWEAKRKWENYQEHSDQLKATFDTTSITIYPPGVSPYAG